MYMDKLDHSQIVQLWNDTIGNRFPMTNALWHQNTTRDSNVNWKGSVAIVENGELLGFVVTKQFQEQLPVQMSTSIGWLQCLLVKSSARHRGIGSKLLYHAEEALKEANVREILLGRDPWHYFPGVPLEDLSAIEWFKEKGYEKTAVETDLKKNMRNAELYKLTNSADHFRVLSDEDVPNLVQFLKHTFPGRWHYEAVHYEKLLGTGREFIGLYQKARLKGFCRINDAQSPVIAQNVYWSGLVQGELGGIGPLGIDKSIRGKHFGLDLVKAAANELASRGVDEIVIDWTQLDSFYKKLGFIPWKRYQGMRKTIGVK
ncbi:GNAT family N-acetyltransferase [Sporosarcina saromensis]|uniref:GNAT family N-acetyltransferase n=1 Tax=Sporosarcina saromensis TaxID=359365 RepID=A0ABU4G685_9BACL|nr:GNAT family N-acetyltransferase [Sporosarcina saromensis]MDW0112490.1 GNAT family N-acetyltransferase [Sporosarcina saromensis]